MTKDLKSQNQTKLIDIMHHHNWGLENDDELSIKYQMNIKQIYAGQ